MKRLSASLVLLCLASSAFAVKTQFFTHTTKDDFAKGTSTGVMVTPGGQIKLARSLDSLLPADRHFDAIPAVALAKDGAIVFATFPDNLVLRLHDGKLEQLAKFDDHTITALTIDPQGNVLVGLAGDEAEVVRLGNPNDKPQTLFKQEGVQYVWSIVVAGDRLLLATGPTGGVYEVAGGKTTEVAKLACDNVLTLLAAPDGTIYAGTDEQGLVYRIDAKTRTPFVLFDAAESEISALVFDAAGNVLAATSETRERPELPALPEKPVGGKPEKAATRSTIDAKPPAAPNPPNEAPGDPIPKEDPPAPKAADPEPVDTDAGDHAKANDHAAAAPESPATAAPTEPSAGGNAVYRIDAKGFVSELFRANTVIYAMTVSGKSIVLGTGENGEIYEIRPETEEANVVARSEAEQVTAILATPDGKLICATSNSGSLSQLSAGYAADGTYESDILDAGVPSTLGQLQLRGALPEKTSLTVQTRSGNIADPDKGGWAEWTAAVPAKEFSPVTSPAARYVQYRLTLATTDAAVTPAVDEIMVAYQKPNLPPRIASIAVAPANDPQNPGNLTVTWDASDPNEDDLRYTLYARQTGRGGWVALAEEIVENTHTWSGRHTADGQYELKVVATDARANVAGQGREVSRVSDGILIDNTPPVIGDVKVDATTVTLRVVDRSGTVAGVEYAVDSTTHWQKSLPDDTMADSPEERYTLALKGLAKGQHTLTVRATDDRGNAGYETISVNVP